MTYQKGKARAVELAQEWQQSFLDGKPHYWSEVAEMQGKLARLAERYGLVREFRENGII